MKFEDVQKHMVDCEKTIEQFYLGQRNKSLNEAELKVIRALNDRTLEIIVDVNETKDLSIPPQLPFTKEDVLNQLAYYQNKFDSMIPRIASPRP